MTILKLAKDNNELPYQSLNKLLVKPENKLKRTSSYDFDDFEDDTSNVSATVDTNAQKGSELEDAVNLQNAYRSLGLDFSEDVTWADILSANKKMMSSRDKTMAEKKKSLQLWIE